MHTQKGSLCNSSYMTHSEYPHVVNLVYLFLGFPDQLVITFNILGSIHWPLANRSHRGFIFKCNIYNCVFRLLLRACYRAHPWAHVALLPMTCARTILLLVFVHSCILSIFCYWLTSFVVDKFLVANCFSQNKDLVKNNFGFSYFCCCWSKQFPSMSTIYTVDYDVQHIQHVMEATTNPTFS